MGYLIDDGTIFLREMTIEDSELIVKWRNQTEIRQNYVYRELFSVQGQQNYFIKNIASHKIIQLIIDVFDGEKYHSVGYVVVNNIENNNHSGESGICIGDFNVHGKGYGPQALKLFTKYLFENTDLVSLCARVFTDNIPSNKTHISSGYTHTGTIDVICSDGEKKQMNIYEIHK